MGGQVAYHGVQQMFVNPSALFVLVISATNDDHGTAGSSIGYKMLRRDAPPRPVLPVITKMGCIDDPEARMNRHGRILECLKDKLPPTTSTLNITMPPLVVCAKSLDGVDAFRAKIVDLLLYSGRFENIGIAVPSSWVRCLHFLDALRHGSDPHGAASHDPADAGEVPTVTNSSSP